MIAWQHGPARLNLNQGVPHDRTERRREVVELGPTAAERAPRRGCLSLHAVRNGEAVRVSGGHHAGRRYGAARIPGGYRQRSEEHTSELQSRLHLVCRLLLEKKKKKKHARTPRSGTRCGCPDVTLTEH